MNYVKKVRSNVKGGISCDLGMKTFIVGPSGTGKSAVINAVEIATTGAASDLAGRIVVKKAIDLITLAPKGQKLLSEVEFDDGSRASFTMERNKEGTKKAVHVYPANLMDPETILPVRSVRGAIVGTPETTRKFFLPLASGIVSDSDVLTRIPETLHALFTEALGQVKDATTPVDRLLSVNGIADKKAAEGSAAAKAQNVVAQAVGQGMAPPVTDSQYAEAAARVKALEGQVENAVAINSRQIAVQNAAGVIAQTEANLVGLKGQYNSAYLGIPQIDAQIAGLQQSLNYAPKPVVLNEDKIAARRIIAFMAETSATRCAICGTTPIDNSVFHQRRAYIADVDRKNALDGAAYHQIETSITTLQAQRASAFKTCETLQQRITSEEQRLVDIRKVTNPDGPHLAVNIEALRFELTQAQAVLRQMDEGRIAWTTAQRATTTAIDTKDDSAGWKNLADACSTAVEALLESGRRNFIARVQGFLPSTDTFDLRLRDGTREVCQMGFVRDGYLHIGLSGAEWARMTAALAAACAPPTGCWIDIPEERAFDPITLSVVMSALVRIPGQVILASPIMPATIGPEWTVIHTDKQEHRKFT